MINEQEKISIDPDICSGKPCIRGTRIMIKNILGMMAGGYHVEKILEAYPELTKEDISAALDYATQVINEEKVILRAWKNQHSAWSKRSFSCCQLAFPFKTFVDNSAC